LKPWPNPSIERTLGVRNTMHVTKLHTLVQRFLVEEAGSYVCSLLLGSIAESTQNSQIDLRMFNFNAFDVTFDFKSRMATIADVLVPDSETKVSLSAFQSLLEKDV
jgi:hypothetical protein